MAISKNKRLLSSYFSVILSISIVLFMMGAFFIIAFNAKKISDDFKEKIPITIYLKNNAKKIETEQLIKKLNLKDYTNSISYISKEKGAEILINDIGEDFIEFYGTNPLLNSIDVFLKSEFVTTIVFDEITNELNNTDFIDEIMFDAPLISLINDNINKIKYWILGIALFFLSISIVVINSSIRLSIYSNRINIKTMQMVGATKHFIRRPFILKSVKLGIIGAIIALIGMACVLFYLDNAFKDLGLLNNRIMITGLFLGVFFLGVLISWISTYFATQRFLNLKTDQLYG